MYYHARPHTDAELQRRALDRYQNAQEILDAALDVARTAPAGTDPLTAILAAMTTAAETEAELRAAMADDATQGE